MAPGAGWTSRPTAMRRSPQRSPRRSGARSATSPLKPTGPPVRPPGSRSSCRRVEAVLAIIEALNRGDVESMLARMDPDFEWWPLESSPVARVYRGRDQVRRYVEDWLCVFECLHVDVEDVTEIGEHVVAVVCGRARGRTSGLALGNRFCQVWTVSDAVAVRVEEYETREQGLAVLGST